MVHLSTTLLLGMACSSTQAWTTAPAVKKSLSTASTTRTSLQAVSRQDFLKTAFAATAATTLTAVVTASPLAAFAAEPIALPNGVTYTVTKKGEGPLPDRGELCAIRFSSGFGDVKIDDIFETPEPYYTRVGSGGLIKGVEETLPLMRVGDRWVLTIPSEMAFGKKGRPSSAGKPRIPADSTIYFDVEMVGLPGKEPELIELIGDV